MLRKKKQTPQEQSDQEFNLALEVPAEQRPKGWRPFVRRNWKRIAAAACATAVAGAFLLPGKGAKPAGVDTTYLESEVERRNITNVFSGSGTIAAANTYTVNALVSGTVLTADFAVGDTIEEGTVLYTIDSSNAANSVEKAQLSLDQAQRNYEDAVDAQYVRSTIGGTLASYKVAVGDVVTAGQEVATVRDASTLLLTLEFPAADAANFTVGQAAQVTLDGTFEAVSGTVRSVSGAGCPEQREPAGAHRDHCGEQHRQSDRRAGRNGQRQRGQRTGIGKIQLPERADHHRLHRRHRDRPLRERGLLCQRRYRAGQDLRQGADQAGAERLR